MMNILFKNQFSQNKRVFQTMLKLQKKGLDTQFDKYLCKKMIIINRLNFKFSSLNGRGNIYNIYKCIIIDNLISFKY